MLELSPRLKMAAELVREGSVIADIGTDHAFLPAYLLLSNTVKKALACDLRKGPLNNAAKTAEIYHLTDKIELRLSDGFDSINEGEADDFIICGMGGSLIAELLERTPWLKNGRYRLIIQPQSHSNDVRKYLRENGYEIDKEIACFDEGRVYNAMRVVYTGNTPDLPPSFDFFGSLLYNTDEASAYSVKRTLDYLNVRYKAESEYGDRDEAEKLKAIITDAEEKINENQRNI